MLAERFFRLGAGAIITFMVARMLGDEALGTYGIVMVWAAFLAPLSHLGLNNWCKKWRPQPMMLSKVVATCKLLFGYAYWLVCFLRPP